MSIRPYVFYKTTELENLKTTFEQRVGDWVNKWLVAPPEVKVSGISQYDPANYPGDPHANCLQVKYTDGVVVLLYCNDLCIANLSSCLLQKKHRMATARSKGSKVGRLEVQLVHKALQDLMLKVTENSRFEPPSDGEVTVKWFDERSAGTGQLLASLLIGQEELDIVIPSQIAEVMIDRHYKCQANMSLYQDDIKKLLTAGALRCEVSLGGASISFDELVSLQVGDVVKLNTSLNDPCDLKFAGSSGGVKCLLGKSDGRIAVKIAGQGA